MAKNIPCPALIADVREKYRLSIGQMAELLGIPKGTLSMAGYGERGLPKKTVDLLQLLAEHHIPSSKKNAAAQLHFPGYVTAYLKEYLVHLKNQKMKTMALLRKSEEEFIRIYGMREHFTRQHETLQEAKVPIRVLYSLKRYALQHDVRIDKVDQHRIVKLRANLAGIKAEIEVIKSALAKKTL